MNTILGLDPGLTGGAVLINQDGSHTETYSFKKLGKEFDCRDYIDWLRSKMIEYDNDCCPITHAFIEKVASRPGQGVASMFKFGTTYGMQRAAIDCLSIPYTLVTPKQWTKVMCAGVDASLKAKDRSKVAFNRLFPNFEPSEKVNSAQKAGLIDALLIAEYGRRCLYGS